jgi:molybdate transport system ATP-binding protein
MKRLGIAQHADTAFGAVSEGEQRMVLVTRALVKQPELLILDEPCQGLDARNRDRVLSAVETMANHPGTSIIYVTHHRDALPRIISHVIKLDEGRVAGRARVNQSNRG